jgi:hypothetical protein
MFFYDVIGNGEVYDRHYIYDLVILDEKYPGNK